MHKVKNVMHYLSKTCVQLVHSIWTHSGKTAALIHQTGTAAATLRTIPNVVHQLCKSFAPNYCTAIAINPICYDQVIHGMHSAYKYNYYLYK